MEEKKMEWLKSILEKAVIKDGVIEIDDLLKSIKTEFPKHAVPKEDYNTKTRELATASNTIKELKEQTTGNEDLQGKISTYETTIANLQKENENTKKEYSLTDELKKSGCNDPGYLIYKHGGIDKFAFDNEGKPIGVEDALKPYKETLGYLFKIEQGKPNYNPAGGDGYSGVNPWKKETFNLTEQGKLFKENPAQAKEMMSAAGTQI